MIFDTPLLLKDISQKIFLKSLTGYPNMNAFRANIKWLILLEFSLLQPNVESVSMI